MSLRFQLLAVSLITLLLPWAGCQYVREMEDSLKNGLGQSLLGSAQTVAAALDGRSSLLYPQLGGIVPEGAMHYAYRLERTPVIDGYASDWEPATRSGIALAVTDQHLFIHVPVATSAVIYEAPGRDGDGIELTVGESGSALLLTTAAPGALAARSIDPGALAGSQRVLAYWVETATGFAIEARIPLSLVRGRLGIDHRRPGETSVLMEPAAVVYPSLRLRSSIEDYARAGVRVDVVSRQGFQLARAGRLADAGFDPDAATWRDRFYRWVLGDPGHTNYESLRVSGHRLEGSPLSEAIAGTPAVKWFRGPGYRTDSARVVAAAPIREGAQVLGAVVMEQASDSVLGLTDRAVSRLTRISVWVVSGVGALLLGFATLLSFRIRRLANAMESALGPKGELDTTVPGTWARDEIGVLARSFRSLLGRLADYTGYLRSLSGKLSHELRTPIAVITSSLENLEQSEDASQRKVYADRIRKGADRLSRLVSAMSEATHLEQAIKETPPERFDLIKLTTGAAEGYRAAFPERRFAFEHDCDDLTIEGSPDLMMQLLDKLVDNAVSFSPKDSTILLRIAGREGKTLSVENEGPGLPAGMENQLFDSLVSLREESNGDRSHLGLGLYIVRLIADYHGAEVRAENLEDGRGVRFGLSLPRH